MDSLRQALESRSLNIGVLAYDGYSLLDVFGPLEVIMVSGVTTGQTPFKLSFISTTEQVARSNGGLEIIPDFLLSDPSLPPMDILLIPGGPGHAKLERNESHLSHLARLCKGCSLVMTVGGGSVVLAKAGVLSAARAVTGKTILARAREKFPEVEWVDAARWVVHGKVYSASGASAVADMSLVLIKELLGEEAAHKGAAMAEYIANPNPSDDVFASVVKQGERSERQKDIVQAVTKGDGVLKVAVLVYENFEMLDTFGPCVSIELFISGY